MEMRQKDSAIYNTRVQLSENYAFITVLQDFSSEYEASWAGWLALRLKITRHRDRIPLEAEFSL